LENTAQIKRLVNTLTQSEAEPDATLALLSERGKTHGDFANHAGCTQELKIAMQHWASVSGKDWQTLPNTHREALEMIAHKIGRIIAGDPDFRDHWDDLAGYATLIAQKCTK